MELHSTKLLDRVKEAIRYKHYSLRTEKVYVFWCRYFIRFHQLRHPKDMGAPEVEAFLSFLANEKQVSPSTHRQALSAILFMYKVVLCIDLPWLKEIGQPTTTRRLPVVLSVDEICAIFTSAAVPASRNYNIDSKYHHRSTLVTLLTAHCSQILSTVS